MLTRNEKQRLSRQSNGNFHTKKYEKTFKGKLVRSYRNMFTRVSGILKTKRHLYMGLPICEKEDFYSWSILDKDYKTLFHAWVESDYDRKLSPSIDRKDISKGYTIDNMRWLTHSENSRLGAQNRGKT